MKAAALSVKRNKSAERGLQLLIDLMNGKPHDRHSAARSLGIAEPAAARHLKNLEKVPGVERAAGTRGLTLRFNANQVMESPNFSLVIAACLSMSLANLFEGTAYQQNIVAACEFLLSRSKRKHRFGKPSDLPRKFIFVKGGGEQALPEKAVFLDELIDAVLSQKQVNIEHIDFDEARHATTFRPLSIAVYKHQLYVLAYNPAGEICNIRFSRILDCQMSETVFEYPTKAEYDPPRLFEPSFGVFVGGQRASEFIKIRLAPRWKTYVRTHRWHRSQEIAVGPDGILVTLRVQICPELTAWVLSFGRDAEVLEPATLRAEVRDHVQALTQMYADG